MRKGVLGDALGGIPAGTPVLLCPHAEGDGPVPFAVKAVLSDPVQEAPPILLCRICALRVLDIVDPTTAEETPAGEASASDRGGVPRLSRSVAARTRRRSH